MSNFAIETSSNTTRLRLIGEVTVEHAHALQVALSEHLRPGTTLVLDASALIRLDMAALQVLLAAVPSTSGAFLATSSPALTVACNRFAVANPFHASCTP